MMKVSDAIQFFFPPNVIEHIMPVLDMARQFSEEESATPMLAAGMQSGQNSETATGALAHMQNSTTLLDLMSEQWDDQITQKVVRRMYAWNMLYGKNDEAKGNYIIDVRSSNEYKNKQLHVRDVERLSMEMAQNPNIAKWINPDALTHLRLSMMNLPSRAILRSPEEAEAWEKQQQEQAQKNDPNVMKMQVEMKKLELAEMQMQLDAQEMQSNQQIAMAKLQMEHETNQTKNQVAMLEAQAMQAEAQAMTMSSQLQHEAKLIELELKAQEMGLRYNTDAAKTAASNQTAVFLKGMDMQNKSRELDIQEQEIALKKQGKTGI
jgi:mannose-6-phosphate isomerase-like protein (cupin superfamily)